MAFPVFPATVWEPSSIWRLTARYAGHIVISDVVKPHSAEAIRALKAAGIRKTVMLSGDIRKVAEKVAEELGLDEVYSELLPADKVEKVEELIGTKKEKEKLAFVGGRHQ